MKEHIQNVLTLTAIKTENEKSMCANEVESWEKRKRTNLRQEFNVWNTNNRHIKGDHNRWISSSNGKHIRTCKIVENTIEIKV